MNDFLYREPELSMSEDVAKLAADALITELCTRDAWMRALRTSIWVDEIYSHPSLKGTP